MDDDRAGRRLDHTYLIEDGSSVASDDHRQALVELEDTDGMGIGVADVFVADSMLAGTRRDDRVGTHSDKLACNEWEHKLRPAR